MSFPEPVSFDEEERTWDAGQLSAALAASHRQLNTALCAADTAELATIAGQLAALRDLQRSVQANDTLNGKLLLLMHGYYSVPLHPQHRATWQRGIEDAVSGWFEPP